MKKVLVLLLTAGIFGFVACGESAEQKAAKEKAMADSIASAQADSISNAASMAADSASMDSAATDSTK
jgi:hypothetical protein